MRADITNIPISDVFEPKEGCPICRLRDMLEKRVTEYITGAAMMEPDVREQTNRLGFCSTHFEMMLKQRNRLGVALILESHLAELDRRVFEGLPLIGKSPARQKKAADKAHETCFTCEQVNWAMERMVANICRLYQTERDFRQLFEQQQCLCLPHFSLLMGKVEEMDRRYASEFAKAAADLCRNYLTTLRGDVTHFTRMFDYRNTGADADWGNSRDAIERAVWFLTSRSPK